jgi:F-type H+-transporting ATPase subunit a
MNSEELLKKMEPHHYDIQMFGYHLKLFDSIIVMWIVMAIMIIGALILRKNLKTVPTGKQNILEAIVDFVNNFSKDMMHHHWRPYAPYFGTLLIFLAISNIISIFNFIPIPNFHISPPTKDINVTATMAIMSIVLVLVSGIRYKKFSGWLKSFVEPFPVVLPFKILDYFVRPLSLCLRLFGNILAAFTIMELIYSAVPLVIPSFVSIYFDLFDGLLQAYIFVFLTSLYIHEAIE